MPLDAEQRRKRARKAAMTRHHPNATAEDLAEIERAKLDAHAQAVADGAPLLSPARREHLALLLCPGHADAGDAA